MLMRNTIGRITGFETSLAERDFSIVDTRRFQCDCNLTRGKPKS